jgi:tripeptide aminopeptidase
MTPTTLIKPVQDGVKWLSDTVDQVVDETIQLCRIPAPTFDEAERAAYVARRMSRIGLAEVRTDTIQNVTGVLRGDHDGPTTLVVAHIDTVFPRSTPLDVRQTAKRLYGPSIGDNSAAVAGMLQVATAMQRIASLLPGRIVFAASVGEEGLGNLCGIRALMETWQGRVNTVIAVEGHGVDEIHNTGLGRVGVPLAPRAPFMHLASLFTRSPRSTLPNTRKPLTISA